MTVTTVSVDETIETSPQPLLASPPLESPSFIGQLPSVTPSSRSPTNFVTTPTPPPHKNGATPDVELIRRKLGPPSRGRSIVASPSNNRKHLLDQIEKQERSIRKLEIQLERAFARVDEEMHAREILENLLRHLKDENVALVDENSHLLHVLGDHGIRVDPVKRGGMPSPTDEQVQYTHAQPNNNSKPQQPLPPSSPTTRAVGPSPLHLKEDVNFIAFDTYLSQRTSSDSSSSEKKSDSEETVSMDAPQIATLSDGSMNNNNNNAVSNNKRGAANNNNSTTDDNNNKRDTATINKTPATEVEHNDHELPDWARERKQEMQRITQQSKGGNPFASPIISTKKIVVDQPSVAPSARNPKATTPLPPHNRQITLIERPNTCFAGRRQLTSTYPMGTAAPGTDPHTKARMGRRRHSQFGDEMPRPMLRRNMSDGTALEAIPPLRARRKERGLGRKGLAWQLCPEAAEGSKDRWRQLLQPGCGVDVLDVCLGSWIEGTVERVANNNDTTEVLVHVVGSSKENDTWFSCNSDQLAPHRTKSTTSSGL